MKLFCVYNHFSGDKSKVTGFIYNMRVKLQDGPVPKSMWDQKVKGDLTSLGMDSHSNQVKRSKQSSEFIMCALVQSGWSFPTRLPGDLCGVKSPSFIIF